MAHLDSEEILLGELISGEQAFSSVAGVLSTDSFPRPEHKRIFQRMADLYDKGHRIDRITVANELMIHNELESVGGLTYLVGLDDKDELTIKRPPEVEQILFDVARRLNCTPEEAVQRFIDACAAMRWRPQ